MSFAQPWLLLLALIPAAGLLVQLVLNRGADGQALPAVLRGFVAGGRVRLGKATSHTAWRFWLGLLLLVLALGRPQWGAKPDDDNRRDEVVIALDLSRSMLATDALPSRVERARTIATRLVAQSPAADIGLIAFAGQAYPLAAPSADRALLRTFLPAVQPDQMVVPGSNFASLLTVALQAFDSKAASRTLVLLSDGEAEPTPWRQVLPRLRARGIHVVAVGLGTPAGAPVRTAASGSTITSRLDTDSLRAVATATGGVYIDAAQSADLAARVRAIGESATDRQARPTGKAKEDRFGWFLVPALVLLLWSALGEWPALPRLVRRGRRWTQPAAYTAVAILAVLAASPRGQAVAPVPAPRTTEPDPLRPVKAIVGRMLAERAPAAADYMALAEAAVRYAEEHRQHPHPLQRGVLSDGLAAIDAGEAIEPGRPGWGAVRAKLVDLLKLPSSADDPEEGDGAPAADQSGTENAPKPDEAGSDPNGKKQDTRSVGGTQRSASGNAEWRVPSLVKPLYTLQKLRAADRPGELFRLLQLQELLPPRRGRQTW